MTGFHHRFFPVNLRNLSEHLLHGIPMTGCFYYKLDICKVNNKDIITKTVTAFPIKFEKKIKQINLLLFMFTLYINLVDGDRDYPFIIYTKISEN